MFHSGSSVYPHFAFSDNIAQPANDLAPDPSDADSFNILPVDDINSAFPMGIPSAADEIWNLLSQDLLPDSHSLHASPNFLAELGISADPLFQLRGDSAAEYLQKDNQASPHSELLLDRPDFEGPSLATDGIPPDTQGTFALSMTNTMIKQMSASRPQDVAPLTAETLALCLNIFWTRVWPTYPMIHPSTFSLGTTSAPLLLSMIALGSLSLQNKEIRRQGEYLWKLVNRSIQNNWEQMIESRGPYDPCKGVQLIQTLALSLIYAATSADNSIVNAACISIASGFRWARLAGTLRPENTNRSLILQPGEELDEFGLNNRWRQWASLEDLKRTLTTIYLLDCCLALISDSPSYAKHLSNPVGNIWDDEATYLAKNPNQWRLAIEASRDKVPILSLLPAEHIYQYLVDRDTASDPDLARVPMMNRQTILAGLTALVLEAEQAGSTHSILGSAQLSSIDSALVRFHSIFLNHTTDPRSKSVLIGQWHHTAILLGYTISRRKGLSGSSLWSNPLGRHLLLHANAIRHNSESIHIGRAKVAHLVQIQTLYMAAVVYLDYVAAHHSIKGYSSLNAYSLNQETDWENLNSALGTCICHDNPSTLSVSPHLAAAINFLASDAIPTVSGLPLGSQDIDPLIMVLSGLGQIYPLARDSADKLRISAGSARE
ncbi:uncharacterized protein I303_105693 [Kwoniella dejecticola CBS 10117]|uniref:Xylanolytic transcriptional activator regulatory domain-containing protein n=1 Tax=Kwoniella dejecticola CBS 10117 TaxID=1296121 RepID=A0A1A6A049_9TREE|nr:uncharacterized protein I303_05715 [Kwoniella dejecticola CBS 10117]OBR83437.1 hypothetical protein I303_05715 [Kwoniella dejecticola CBS 10117]